MPARYAVNIGDLANPRYLIPAQCLIAPVAPNRNIIDCEPGRLDGGAVELECDEERALAIIHILRVKQPNKNLLRCYSVNGKTAKRV